MGLGLSVYSTVFVGLMGATSALSPIVAQHFGGGRLAAIGATYVQGLWMALFLSAPGVVPLLCGDLWLPWLQAPAEVETQVARYLRVLLRAYRRAIAPTVIHAVALWGLGVVGGYLVAFGGLGGPPWGIAGMWLMQSFALAALLLLGFYLGLPRLRRLRRDDRRPRYSAPGVMIVFTPRPAVAWANASSILARGKRAVMSVFTPSFGIRASARRNDRPRPKAPWMVISR
jgi:Na+-driven multidrug efflux pump